MSINPKALQLSLEIGFWLLFTLNILDIVSTLYGLRYIPGFYEKNIYFAPALHSAYGILSVAAVFLKSLILIIPAIAVYYPHQEARHVLFVRVIKFGVLIGLISGLPIYLWSVANNILLILLS